MLHSHRMGWRRGGWAASGALAVLALGSPARGAVGATVWKFHAEYSVTVLEPIADLSGNGGRDILVGSQHDTLYAVEAKGAAAGKPLWSFPFGSPLSAAAAMPDLDGDGKPEAAGGDQSGRVAVIGGADGKPQWSFLTGPGILLSLAALPDVNGDGTADLAAGSELDSVYCLSGHPGSGSGKALWTFAIPPNTTRRPPAAPPPAAKITAAAPDEVLTGAGSLALIGAGGNAAFGLAVGTHNDTLYCLGPADGAVKWKSVFSGDILKVVAFPDMNGDGVEEVLLACSNNMGHLVDGATGDILWTRLVKQRGLTVAAVPDLDGDGKTDALIGDANGTIHCVSGAGRGTVRAVWMYDFRDAGSILSLASPGDVDGDGSADCVAGTSNDTVALISGKGKRIWAAGMGGKVPAVAAWGDIDGDGSPDWVAGSAMGFAEAFSGGPGASLLPPRPRSARGAMRLPRSAVPLFARPGAGAAYDGRGRAMTPLLPGKRPDSGG